MSSNSSLPIVRFSTFEVNFQTGGAATAGTKGQAPRTTLSGAGRATLHGGLYRWWVAGDAEVGLFDYAPKTPPPPDNSVMSAKEIPKR
jgi:hypothetical protein